MMFNITSVEKLISLLSNQNLRNWECDEKDKEQSKSKAKQSKANQSQARFICTHSRDWLDIQVFTVLINNWRLF